MKSVRESKGQIATPTVTESPTTIEFSFPSVSSISTSEEKTRPRSMPVPPRKFSGTNSPQGSEDPYEQVDPILNEASKLQDEEKKIKDKKKENKKAKNENNKINKKNEKIKEKKNKKKNIEEQIEQLKEEKAKEKEKLEDENNGLKTENNQAREVIKGLQDQITKAKEEKEEK